jgi:hypothetical protein
MERALVAIFFCAQFHSQTLVAWLTISAKKDMIFFILEDTYG